ncbi:CYTH domain-containing protein [Psychroflexus sp. ALD_RP9]|uniref:CYTH domain-containing protein n=1 Tax=Psychroflexus sp. ALD_RP9 TaxID=2777186 RepID=UPI001A90A184|nr:CYTH domain-containing protein [Psychroflexus sp. ALD_RP9]QSS96095.1 CYTH domain-containing protein [Psychroflexus sp. ALD_RP9]
MQEVERKFLVNSTRFIKEAESHYYIKQAYLNTHPQRSVRVRILAQTAFLTVKGQSSQDGTSRFEWEKPISILDAQQLLQLCEDYPIEKTRYVIPFGLHNYEVDVFEGENKGLILAEIELSKPNETFKKPDWLGKEVTGEIKYYNSSLSKKPFKKW